MKSDKRDINRCVTLYDLLIAFVVIQCLIIFLSEEMPPANVYYALVRMLFIYTSLRLLFLLIPNFSRFAIFIVLTLFCVKELYLGFCQLLGFSRSNHYLYAITGSFHNPGPYGGFLAVCTSLLLTFYLKVKDYSNDRIIRKLSQSITLIVIILAFIIIPSTQSRSAILAFGCSMILFVSGNEFLRTKIKPIIKKYGLLLLLCITILMVGAYLFKKPSANGRLFIDKICLKAICENRGKGAGIGNFGRAYGDAQANYFKEQIKNKGKDNLDWKAITEFDRMTADCPDNAFNEYLFIGVEAGPIAMLLFLGIVITAIIISYARGSIWCYGLTALAVFAMFSYPLHLLQFQILFPVLLSASISEGEEDNKRRQRTEIAILASAMVILTAGAINKLSVIKDFKQAKYTWKEVENWYQMDYYEYVVENCDTLLNFMKHDHRFLFAYGQSLNKIGNYEKSDSILKLGTKISSDPMFWNVMGNNSLAQGRYAEAEERYMHAFYMVPNRIYPLYLLTKLYYAEGDTMLFYRMSEVVNGFIPKVESYLTDSLRNDINNIR